MAFGITDKLRSGYAKVRDTLDRDKSMSGFQLARGGITSRIPQPIRTIGRVVSQESGIPQMARSVMPSLRYNIEGVRINSGLGSSTPQYRQFVQNRANQSTQDFRQGATKLALNLAPAGIGRAAKLAQATRLAPYLQKAARAVQAGRVIAPAAGAAIGGGINKLTGGDVIEGATQGAIQGWRSNAVAGMTNPLLNRLLPKSPTLLNNRLLPAAYNAAQGQVIDAAEGRELGDPLSLGIDVATGLMGGRSNFANIAKSRLKPVNLPEPKTAYQKKVRDFSLNPKIDLTKVGNKLRGDINRYRAEHLDIWAGTKTSERLAFINKHRAPEQAYGAVAGVEPYQDENGEWKVRFNPTNAAIGIGAVAGVKAIKGDPNIFGNTKPIKFDGKYETGDIGKLTKALDDALGTEDFNNKGKWTSGYAARQTAKQSLEFDAQSSPEARQLLDYVNGLEQQIEQAQGLKGMKIDRTQLTGRQLSVPNSKLHQSLPTNKLPKLSELQDYERGLTSSSPPREALRSGEAVTLQSRLPTKEQPVPKKVQSPIQELQQAQQAAQLKGKTSQIVPSVEDIVRSSNLDVKNKVNALDYLRTPDRVLQKIGLAKEAEVIKTQYNKYLDELPKEIDRITSWYESVGKSKEASTHIFKYLDGEKITLKGAELKVATEIKQYLSNWADRLGLPKDGRIASYITHIFEKDFIQKEFDPELAKLITDKVPSSVYDPFLQQRLGKKGYIQDAFLALDAYVKRATRKANMDVALEQLEAKSGSLDVDSWKYVKAYTERINLRPTDLDNLVDNLIKSSPAGYKAGQRPVAAISRNLRQMVYRGTLGLNVGSALRNLTQGANTYAQLGEKYTGIGYMKAAKAIATGSDELEISGVLRNSFIEDRNISSTKKFWEKLDKGLFFFFEGAEKLNRGAAYFGAKSQALAKGLSEEEAVKAGVEMARKTQFTFGSVDSPVALQSDIVKLLTQFQSFNVKQTEFIVDMAKNKEYAGMVRWLGANAVLLATLGQVMGWDWKDMIPFGGVLDGQSPIGSSPAFTLAKDGATLLSGGNDRYGQPMKPKKLLEDLVPLVPAGVQIKKTVGGLMDTSRGYAKTATGLVKYPIEKTAGNILTAATLGTSKLKVARDYRENEDKQLGENQSKVFKLKSGQDRQNYYNTVINKRNSEGEKETADKPSLMSKLFGKAQASDSNWESYFELPEYSALPSGTNQQKAIKEDARQKIISSVMSDEDVDIESKIQVLSKVGEKVSKQEVEYYQVAALDNDIKTGFVLDEISSITDSKKRIEKLATLRQPVLGKMILADGVIDDLYDQGLVTSSQKKYLKSLDFEKGTDGKYTLKKGSGRGGKKMKQLISDAQLLAALAKTMKAAAPSAPAKSATLGDVLNQRRKNFKLKK